MVPIACISLLLPLLWVGGQAIPECPQRCHCAINKIRCRGTKFGSISPHLLENLEILHLSDCNSAKLDLDRLQNSTGLHTLIVEGCQTSRVNLQVTLRSVKKLVLTDNYLTSWPEIASLFESLPSLSYIDLRKNQLTEHLDGSIDRYIKESSLLRTVDLSENSFSGVPSLPSGITHLSLAHNAIQSISHQLPTSLQSLNLSHNSIWSSEAIVLDSLQVLDISHNKFDTLEFLNNSKLPDLSILNASYNWLNRENSLQYLVASTPSLHTILLSNSEMQYIDMNWFKNIKDTIDLSQNSQLMTINGSMNGIQAKNIYLKGCGITSLPVPFFKGSDSGRSGDPLTFDLSNNPLACDCRIEWVKYIPLDVDIVGNCSDGAQLTRSVVNTFNESCNIGLATQNGSIVRVKYGHPALLRCEQYGDPPPSISWQKWHLDHNYEVLASWAYGVGWWAVHNITEDEVEFLPNGILRIKNVYKGDVGRYMCFASNEHGTVVHTNILLRLDYSSWTIWVKLLSVVAGIVAAILSIILHSMWSALRACVLWRIRTREKRSRVRKMLEAMEKYRMKQMETIHEKYVQRMNNVRDNYNQQCEQLRVTYANRVDRFRDYRSAQMDAAWQTIDNMREQYNSQVDRLREYGGRNMERLSEGYQRQMNRVRTFSLQQRLRLMRQYKIKNQYINKLIDRMNSEHKLGDLDTPSIMETEFISLESPLYEPFTMIQLAHEPFLLSRLQEIDESEQTDDKKDEDDTLSVTTYHSLPDMEIPDIESAAVAFEIDLPQTSEIDKPADGDITAPANGDVSSPTNRDISSQDNHEEVGPDEIAVLPIATTSL